MLNRIVIAFGALRNRYYCLLWLGSLSAFIGFFTSNVVQQVVAFQLTSANRSVGFVVFGRGLAQIILGPIGGALADRFSKRSILLICQSMTALVFAGLAWLMYSGRMTVMYLVVGGFLVGITFAFLGPTRAAYVVDIVDVSERGNAIALTQVALNVSRVIGPALAGLLLAWKPAGGTLAFIIMAVLYLGALLFQRGLPPARPDKPSTKGLLEDIIEGFTYVRGNSRLRLLLSMFVLVVMTGFPYITVLPGLVEHQYGLPVERVSVLFGIGAAFGLLSSVAMAGMADAPHALLWYRGSGALFGLSLVGLCQTHDLSWGTAAMATVGFTSGCFTTLHGAVVLKNTDPSYMGRVMSLGMLAFGAFGLCGIPVGIAADAFGERATLAAMGVSACLTTLILGIALARTPEPHLPNRALRT